MVAAMAPKMLMTDGMAWVAVEGKEGAVLDRG